MLHPLNHLYCFTFFLFLQITHFYYYSKKMMNVLTLSNLSTAYTASKFETAVSLKKQTYKPASGSAASQFRPTPTGTGASGLSNTINDVFNYWMSASRHQQQQHQLSPSLASASLSTPGSSNGDRESLLSNYRDEDDDIIEYSAPSFGLGSSLVIAQRASTNGGRRLNSNNTGVAE